MKVYTFLPNRNATPLYRGMFIKLTCLSIAILLLIILVRQDPSGSKENSKEKEFKKSGQAENDWFGVGKLFEQPLVSPVKEEQESNKETLKEQETDKNSPSSNEAAHRKKIQQAVADNARKDPIKPSDLDRSPYRPKKCIGDVPAFLTKVRNRQQELVARWRNTEFDPLLKWVSLSGVYDPTLIDFRLMYHFVVDGENKYMLDFVKRDDPECNIYTLGVGQDYGGEVRVWNRYPQCKMTAVDPMPEINKEIVERVPGARFIQATIGERDGNYTARLRQLNRKYETVTVSHFGLTDFLQKHNSGNLIDLLIMDIEGAELGILPILIEEKHKLPTICQLNVELHFPPESYGYKAEQVLDGLHKFFSNGTYTVFNIEVFLRLVRMFVVNTEDPACVEKFLC